MALQKFNSECIGFSEIEPHAIAVYKYHYRNHKNYGDARNIIPGQLPRFELLVGGFPCQAFSIAGKREGFSDTRGTLFFEIARILSDKRPEFIILENVKGLLGHDNRRTIITILETLSDLGYSVGYQVLNSKFFNVPQNRERVFIIGTRTGSISKILPVREGNELCVKERGEIHKTASTLNAKGQDNWTGDFVVESKQQAQGGLIELTNNQNQANRVYSSEGISKTLAGTAGGGGAKTGLYKVYNLQPCIRKLTPLECERVMGWQDNWTKYGLKETGEIYELKDNARYRLCGNGVVPQCVEAIVEKLFKAI